MSLRPSRGRKLLTVLIASLVFAASASYVGLRFQWREIFRVLLKADFVRLCALTLLGHFAYIMIRACRWRTAVRNAVPEVTFWDCYWITAVVVSLSMLTPGHSGEAIKIEIMKRRGLLGRLPGLGAFAVERVMDTVMLSALGAFGLFFGSYSTPYPGFKAAAIAVALLGAAALGCLAWIDPGRRASRRVTELLRAASPRAWASMAVFTFLAWVVIALVWHVSLIAVDIHLKPAQVFLLIWIVTIGAVLSFIPGGLGISELVTAAVLTNMGIAAVTAQAGTVILHVYGLVAIVFGLVHLGLWRVYGSRTMAPESALVETSGSSGN